jgi:hypothetical protein
MLTDPPPASTPRATVLVVMLAFLGSGVLVGRGLRAGAAAVPTPAAARAGVAAAAAPLGERVRWCLPPDGPVAAPPSRLRIRSLHHAETLDVAPFDGSGRADPESFARVRDFFRASSGADAPVDERLVRLLVRLHEAVDAPLVLVSGHRGVRLSSARDLAGRAHRVGNVPYIAAGSRRSCVFPLT